MTKHSDNPADPFKKALADATRTMADDSEMTVTFSVDPAGMTKEGVRLPQVSRRMSRDEVLLARGTADAFALRRKYHNEATASRYAPTGQLARDIYEAMELARCEAVGARAMPGTASNIDAKIAHEAVRKGYSQITSAADAPLPLAAGYLVRHLATGRDLPLYDASTKYDSGTGWPSFYAPIKGAVRTKDDPGLFGSRTEVHCRRCGGHLGHVFDDGPAPTGKRYCMNGLSLKFVAA